MFWMLETLSSQPRRKESEKPQGGKSCGRGKPRAPESTGRHLRYWGCREGFLEEVMLEVNGEPA